MKSLTLPHARWFLLAWLIPMSASLLIFSGPYLLAWTLPTAVLLLLCWRSLATVTFDISANRWRRTDRPRRKGAGRWLDAPVAELDKSTLGKLLASRASRDPGLHVVVRSTPTPTCTDVLYDPEIDG